MSILGLADGGCVFFTPCILSKLWEASVKCYQIRWCLSLPLCWCQWLPEVYGNEFPFLWNKALIFWWSSAPEKEHTDSLGNGNLLIHRTSSRKATNAQLLLPTLQCYSGQGLPARHLTGHVCSGTGFWILFSSCCFLATWVIAFVDLAAESDDLFHVNHWTLFICRQLWIGADFKLSQ